MRLSLAHWRRGLLRDPAAWLIVSLVSITAASTGVIGAASYLLASNPAGVDAPERVVRIGGLAHIDDALAWWGQAAGLERLAAYEAADVMITGRAGQRWVRTVAVSDEFFSVLSITPTLGRPPSGEPGATEAMVSHRLWRAHLGADPFALGQALTLDGRTLEIVGVAPPGYGFPFDADVWLPAAPGGLRSPVSHVDGGGDRPLPRLATGFVGRVRADSSIQEVHDQLMALLSRLGGERSALSGVNYGTMINLQPMSRSWAGQPTATRAMVWGALCAMLLAATSLTILLLARRHARRKENMIRVALGASGRDLWVQNATEALVTATMASVLGVLAGVALLTLLQKLIPTEPATFIDRRDLWTLALSASAAGAVFAVLLSCVAAAKIPSDWPRQDARAPWRAGQTPLVFVQTAAATALLLGTLASVEALRRAFETDHGFQEGVIAFALRGTTRGPDADDSAMAAAQLALSSLSRVTSAPVGVSSKLPLWSTDQAFQQLFSDDASTMAAVVEAKGDILQAWGVPLMSGVMPPDLPDDGVALSESLARRLFASGPAIGRVVRLGSTSARVLAVVGDTSPIDKPTEPQPTVYQSMRRSGVERPGVLFLSLACRDCQQMESAIAESLRSGPFSLSRVWSFRRELDRALAQPRDQAQVWILYGVIAAGVALAGIFTIVAYGTVVRRREFGVRMALGAAPHQVVWVASRAALAASTAGLLVGCLLARRLGFVAEVNLGAVTFVLTAAGVAAAAASLPAYQASRRSPAEELRSVD